MTRTTRPARDSDFRQLFQSVPRTCRAWVVVDPDDRPLGIGGYYKEGGLTLVFSDLAADLPKIAVVKLAQELMSHVPKGALCSCTPGSERLLSMLGWKPSAEYEGVWSWPR